MKRYLIVLLACGALAGGCATENNTTNSNPANSKREEKTPEIGMTKDQVLAMYGKTDNVRMSSEGETWIYHMNVGEAFIPWNFGYRPKIRIIEFDKDGKVARWSYSK